MVKHSQRIHDLVKRLPPKEELATEKETKMADDPTKTGQDRKFIALDQENEVPWWTQSLGLAAPGTFSCGMARIRGQADPTLQKIIEELRKPRPARHVAAAQIEPKQQRA